MREHRVGPLVVNPLQRRSAEWSNLLNLFRTEIKEINLCSEVTASPFKNQSGGRCLQNRNEVNLVRVERKSGMIVP